MFHHTLQHWKNVSLELINPCLFSAENLALSSTIDLLDVCRPRKQGPRDGFCLVTVSQVDLSVASLDTSVRLVIDLVLQSWEMQSSPLLGGQPWVCGLWHCLQILCVLHSVDVAKVFQFFFVTNLFSTSCSRFRDSLIFVLRILSTVVTPSMRRKS